MPVSISDFATLREPARAWVRASCKWLHRNGHDAPLVQDTHWRKSGNSFSTWASQRSRPSTPFDWAVQDLPEWEGLLAAIRPSASLTERFGLSADSQSPGSAPVRMMIDELLLPSWNGRADQATAFENAVFDGCFETLQSLMVTDEVVYELLTPINLLELEAASMEVESGLTLEKLSDVDILKLLRYDFLPAEARGVYSPHLAASAGLYRRIRCMRSDELRPGGLFAFLDEAARVLDAVYVSVGGLAESLGTAMTREPDVGMIGGRPHAGTSFYERFHLPRVLLKSHDLDALRSAWNAIASENRPAFALAASRLRAGVMRPNTNEALIDIMIAAESFFGGRQKTQGEQTFRVAMRAAHYLSLELDERTRIYKSFEAAYNARNSIVHGSRADDPIKVGTETIPLKELSNRVAAYLRDALLKSLTDLAFQDGEPDRTYWDKLVLEPLS